MEFYDVKTNSKFTTEVYEVRTVNGKQFAVAISPGGNESWRPLGSSR